MFLGSLKESKYVKYIKSSDEITVTAGSKEFQIDGEPILFDGPINVRLGSNFLKVIRTRHNKL
jgi:uncharacterized Zn-binding protein involved in type VI secretion